MAWIPRNLNKYADCAYVQDRDGLPVVLFKSEWSVNWAKDKYKALQFLDAAPLARARKKSSKRANWARIQKCIRGNRDRAP